MSPSECAKLLRQHQEWRRFDGDIPDSPPMLSPKVIGEAIDAAIRIVDQFVELNELVKQRDDLLAALEPFGAIALVESRLPAEFAMLVLRARAAVASVKGGAA